MKYEKLRVENYINSRINKLNEDINKITEFLNT